MYDEENGVRIKKYNTYVLTINLLKPVVSVVYIIFVALLQQDYNPFYYLSLLE